MIDDKLKEAFLQEVYERILNFEYYDFDCFFEDNECTEYAIEELLNFVKSKIVGGTDKCF